MNIGWKMISLGLGAAAGLAAKMAVDIVWEKGLGKQKPTGDDNDLDQPFAQIVAFTVVTALATSIATEAVRRGTAKAYGVKSTSSLAEDAI